MSLDIYITDIIRTTVFDGNITHNLVPMWEEAGCYEALYDSSGKKARSILPKLKRALKAIQADPDKYKVLEPANGWGTYESAINFLEKVIEACKNNPNGELYISK